MKQSGRTRASIMPRITGLVVLARARAPRGDPGSRDLLEAAWSLAEPTGELHRMGDVVAALPGHLSTRDRGMSVPPSGNNHPDHRRPFGA
jgi:hypothetical protein